MNLLMNDLLSLFIMFVRSLIVYSRQSPDLQSLVDNLVNVFLLCSGLVLKSHQIKLQSENLDSGLNRCLLKSLTLHSDKTAGILCWQSRVYTR